MIRFHDPHAIKLIAQAAHIQYVPKLHYCIADYDNNDCLRGGTLYTDFWGGSIMCHFAGFRKGWISKPLLWLGFDFPFNQLKVKKLFGIIPEWNWQSRNLALHLGYKIEILLADVFDFTHGVNGMYVVSMEREDCRWLNMPKPHIELAPMNLTNRPLAMVE
jgi:hypothetical protein